MAVRNEIHVGDFDTEYVIPTYDNGVNFDASGAAAKTIEFRMPGTEALITRAAAAAQRTVKGATVWCLVYSVTEADLAAGFHQEPGPIKMQGKLDYVTGFWSSNILSKDADGQPLKVYPNLE